MLSDKFNSALRSAMDVSSNPYLVHLSRALSSVEIVGAHESDLDCHLGRLAELIEKPNFALDPVLASAFSQILGEAHFYCLCLDKGIRIRRIPERNVKTPDFQCERDGHDLFFEVKTLSVADGLLGLNKVLNSSLSAKIDLYGQLQSGKNIAIAETTIQPYGNRPYRRGTIRAIIEILIEKARQNFKADQFAEPNTFLVVNLSIIPPFRTETKVLRPAYCDDYMFPKALSGELWMMAFSQPGMLVHGTPEFEGNPCIEGRIDKEGLLVENETIAALLFMIHPWNYATELWGLLRFADHKKVATEDDSISDTLLELVGYRWNDELDSNGWQLNS